MIRLVLFILATAFLGTVAEAQEFRATIYSDGLSCPGDCDAHVVFANRHNGTKYASAPASSRQNPEPCRNGRECRICFGSADSSCLKVIYRGGGPSDFTFDFTPAFFESYCGRSGLPGPVDQLCGSFQRRYDDYTRDAVYCVSDPRNSRCRDKIAEAEARKAEDKVLYDECLRVGEAAFNRAHPRAQRRSLSCAYERHGTGGPNSRGTTWRRLLPAACQAGAYVGRDGLDCCDSNHMSLGGLGKECTPYLVQRSG